MEYNKIYKKLNERSSDVVENYEDFYVEKEEENEIYEEAKSMITEKLHDFFYWDICTPILQRLQEKYHVESGDYLGNWDIKLEELIENVIRECEPQAICADLIIDCIEEQVRHNQ